MKKDSNITLDSLLKEMGLNINILERPIVTNNASINTNNSPKKEEILPTTGNNFNIQINKPPNNTDNNSMTIGGNSIIDPNNNQKGVMIKNNTSI
jgi:hypothetical protein